MKKLLLIRHAKASHDNVYRDFERPLTPSGLRDATTMAERLHAQNIIPQAIISSPALRAETTANVLSEHLGLPKAHTDMLIYDAKKGDLLKVINGFSAQYDFIALAGHNPDISDTLTYLTGEIKDVPPGTVAVISFEIDDWKMMSKGIGDLIHYDTPDN